MALIDNFSTEELKKMVEESTSFRELAKKLGYASIGNNNITIKDRLNRYNISTEHFTGRPKGQVVRTEQNVFCEDSSVTQHTLRRWYLKGNYTEYKCAICGLLPQWNGKELTLTLDHINGNNHDNRLENLRWICPNCDRQLDTFAGKNTRAKIRYNSLIEEESHNYCKKCGEIISKGATYCVKCYNENRRTVERPAPEVLKQELIQGNFCSVARKYGVTDNAIRKWCKAYGMSTSSKDYK